MQLKHWRYKLLTLVIVFPVFLFAQTETGNNSQSDSADAEAARGVFNVMNGVVAETQDKIEGAVADSTQADTLIAPGVLKTMVNYNACLT